MKKKTVAAMLVMCMALSATAVSYTHLDVYKRQLQVRGKSFEEIKSRYERSQEKYLDIGHLQILILSQDLTETDMWKDFFEYLREEPLAGENIYVFQTQEPEKLLGWKLSLIHIWYAEFIWN